MRHSILVAAIVSGVAALAPAVARAELKPTPALVKPALVFSAPRLPTLGWLWSASIAMQASTFEYVVPEHARDEASMGRLRYQLITSLPQAESVVRTYDVSPLVSLVTYQKFELTPDLALTFIAGRNLVVAEIGNKASVYLKPVGFGSGGTFSVAAHF